MGGFYEELRARQLRKQGYVVFTSGLPDLVAFLENADGTVSILVEEEKGPNAPFQPNQIDVLKWFKRAGAASRVVFRGKGPVALEEVSENRAKPSKPMKFDELSDGGRRYYINKFRADGKQSTSVKYQCSICKVWRACSTDATPGSRCIGCRYKHAA